MSSGSLAASLFLFSFHATMSIGLAVDTDHDGLDDSVETNTGNYVSESDTGTDPFVADTDNDGVPDGVEVRERTSPVDNTSYHPFNRGLVVYYPLDSSTDDWSGTANPGVVEGGAEYGTDRFGNPAAAISLSSSQHVGSESNLGISGNHPLTASFWFRAPVDPVWPNGYLLFYGLPGEQGRSFSPVYAPYDEANFRFDGFYANSHCSALPQSRSGQWTHLVISYQNDLSGIRIYVNGVPQACTPILASGDFQFDWADSRLWINLTPDRSQGIAGSFDDVRFYGRSLTADEAISLYYHELGDEDRDGILDRYETGTGVYQSTTETGTKPDDPDSDGDGLLDGAEVNVHGTNPNVADTDEDGFNDGVEYFYGKSPTNPADKPVLIAEIRTAVELSFPSATGKTYRIEGSTDLETWELVEPGVEGTGNEISRFYSTRGIPKRFLRVEEE